MTMAFCRYLALFLVCVSLAHANDAATYAEASSFGMGFQSNETITVGDLNADGAPDVVSSANFGPTRYFLNNGTPDPFAGVEGVAIDGAAMANGAATGDVDGDGHVDIVIRSFGARNQVFLNNGNPLAPFAGVQGLDLSSESDDSTDIELADMDGNGSLDVLVANTNRTVNRLYLNNGTANPFDNVTALDFGSTEGYWNDLSIADIDADGNLDVAFANEISGFGATVEVFLNNGTADPFVGVSPVELTNSLGFLSVQLADLTGDGRPDVAASESSSDRVLIFVNNGTSVPYADGESVSVTPLETAELGVIATRDMNLDGHMDLVAGFYPNFETQSIKVFLSNGTSDPFAGQAATIVGPGQAFRAYAAEDLNNDGVPDIAVGRITGGADRVYLGSLGPDTIPPLVSVLAPAEGAMISGMFTLSAAAADNLGVASVEFLANDQVVATLIEPPFEYALYTTPLSNTMATIAAVATDAAGNTATDTVSVLVVDADTDGDSILDSLDNCVFVSNPLQRDTEGDGIGNACDADLTNDCLVNFSDLNLFKQRFFSSDADADFDGDGAVNFVDLEIMKNSFFGAPGPSGIPNMCS